MPLNSCNSHRFFQAALFYGKALANTLQLLLVMMVMLPLIALCDVWFVEGFGLFIITMVLGAFGLSAPGAMRCDDGSIV